MKKYLLPCTVLVLAAAILVCGISGADRAYDPYSAFRLHIIANSDSTHDQSIKLAVRDALLDYERELFSSLPEPPANAAETRALLMEHGAELLSTVKTTLEARGVHYSASLHVGEYTFPDRSYGDVQYPAGEYQALRVVLGSGKGRNWWCVMFPPLCIVEDVSGQSDGITENDNAEGTIKLKSLFADIFDWVRDLFSGESNAD